MADIFGRQPGDYAHIRALEGEQKGAGPRRHDFAALGQFQGRRVNMDDAQALGYLTNNLRAVQSVVEETLYTEYRLDKFVPIFTDIPEGAAEFGYNVVDGRGDAGWVDNMGTNAGSATASLRHVAYSLHIFGEWAKWSYEDLRKSAMAGVPLNDHTIKRATQSMMDFMERVGLSGSTEKPGPSGALLGLVNQTTGATGDSVRLDTLSNGQRFSAVNGDQMAARIAEQISMMVEDSSEIIGRTLSDGMMVYLPIAQHNLLTTTRLTDSPNLTAWEWVKKNNQWSTIAKKDLELEVVAELKDAAVNGADDRMIIGLKTREIMEFALAIAPRVGSVIDEGFSAKVPLVGKTGGLQVKRGIGLRYVDNV